VKIFRTAEESLQAAQIALAQAEARIQALEVDREAKIAAAEGDDDYVDIGARNDAEIGRLRAAVDAHHFRIGALLRRQHDHERLQQEQRRVAAVAEIRKILPRRQAAAERLDAALKQAVEALAALEAADDAVFADWTSELPAAETLNYLHAMHIHSLSSVRKQRMAASPIREMAARAPFGIADLVGAMNRELLGELENAPASIADSEAA
jgi:hypothetical protein